MTTQLRNLFFNALGCMFFVLSTQAQTTVTIGTGTISSSYPFTTFYMDGKTNILLTATELSSGGAVAGNITQIGFDVITANAAVMNGFTIKMQHTALASLSTFTPSGWTTVYSAAYAVPGTGWQMNPLSTPFAWDGINNLLIEICFDNASFTTSSIVNASAEAAMTFGNHTDLPAGSGCNLTTGSLQPDRPNTRLTFSCLSPSASSITGALAACIGSSQNYSVTNVAGVSFAWTLPVGWSQTGGGTSNNITVTVGNNPGNITCTPSNSCVVGATQTLAVTANANPTITVNSGTICAGQAFIILPNGADTYTIQGGATSVNPMSNSNYTVVGSSTVGCVSVNTATCDVTVNPSPTVSAISNGSLICAGETVTLTATGAISYTFNPGGVGNNIVVSPTVTTMYTVNGVGTNGCTNSTILTQNVSPCTGFLTLSAIESQIHIYPNPSSGVFIIELSNMSNITVIDVLGKIMYSQKLDKGKHNINLTNFTNGLYILKAENTSEVKTIRLVKD